MNQLDSEEAILQEQLANFEISQAEYIRIMREMQRDSLVEARRAAEEAYDLELERW